MQKKVIQFFTKMQKKDQNKKGLNIYLFFFVFLFFD
tara:strand:- start:87 stop:194 length:108 start_codon:yes stop_codon:yes gene_type:complete